MTFNASGAGVYTPEGYAEALQQFGASINPAIRRGLRTCGRVVRAIYLARFTSRGVGRGIFGKKGKSAAGKLVKVGVVGPRGNAFVLALELRGFAALQETGGHTNPPRKGLILPKFRKALKLKVPSLGVVFAASAKHKGARIPANPSAPTAFQQAAPKILKALDEEISSFKHRGVAIATSSAA